MSVQYYEFQCRARDRERGLRAYLGAGLERRGNGWLRWGVGELGELEFMAQHKSLEYRVAPWPSEDPYTVPGPATYRLTWRVDEEEGFEETFGNHWCAMNFYRTLRDAENTSDIQLEYCARSLEDPAWDELRGPWHTVDPDLA